MRLSCHRISTQKYAYDLEQLSKYTYFIHVYCCTLSTTLVMPKDLLNLCYCFRGALQTARKSGGETGRVHDLQGKLQQ